MDEFFTRIDKRKTFKTSYLSKVQILEMRDVLTKMNVITDTPITIKDYMVINRRINETRNVDVSSIKMELHNIRKLSERDYYYLSIKYFQPISVIVDIINSRYDSETNVVYSKLYTLRTLILMYKDYASVQDFDILNKHNGKVVKDVSEESVMYYMYGSDFLKAKHLLTSRTSSSDINGTKYITLRGVNKILGYDVNDKSVSYTVVEKKCDLLGVKINTNLASGRVQFSEEDILKALENKRYYTDRLNISSWKKSPDHIKHIVSVIIKLQYPEYNDKVHMVHKGIAIDINKYSKIFNKHGICGDSSHKLFKEVFETLEDKPKHIDYLLLSKLLGVTKPTMCRYIRDHGSLFGVNLTKNELSNRKISYNRTLKFLKHRSAYIRFTAKDLYVGLNENETLYIRKQYTDSMLYHKYILRDKYSDVKKSIKDITVG